MPSESKDKVFYSKNTLCVNGNLMDLTVPKIMGILNVTDDSFFDGGKYVNEKSIAAHAEKLIEEGADIIDLGGYSSRPGATHIDEEIETLRVLSGLKAVRSISREIPVSVDTFRSTVAEKAFDQGANIINDISGGNQDNKMFETVAKLKVPYVLMHMKGNSQNMTQHTDYNDLMNDIIDYFSKKINRLTQLGVKDVIIDGGFGFSKNQNQNYDLLNKLRFLKILNAPILVGISRKSMIYQALKTSPENALNGTTVLHTLSILNGTKILRVHDVKAAKEVITLYNLAAS